MKSGNDELSLLMKIGFFVCVILLYMAVLRSKTINDPYIEKIEKEGLDRFVYNEERPNSKRVLGSKSSQEAISYYVDVEQNKKGYSPYKGIVEIESKKQIMVLDSLYYDYHDSTLLLYQVVLENSEIGYSRENYYILSKYVNSDTILLRP